MPNSSDIELLQPGETIFNGQYTIEKHLGSGGQGQVYLARHRIFDQVAVKRLHRHIADQPEGRARFERELRITDQLRGEHVIFIRNFDRDPARDEWFSVMEYANGGSLEDKLATEAPLPVIEAIQLATTLCQALALVHKFPYVHGDLKPSNILFHTTPTGKRILKLSDFGSAFQPVQAGVLPLPSVLKEARTTLYVSPELLDASDPEDMEALKVDMDQRVDIYVIGVILYEMLIGSPPFWEPSGESEDGTIFGERHHTLLQKVKLEVPLEPNKQRREILFSLNALVMKALAKDSVDRFTSVGEMETRLKEILREEKARLAELASLHPMADQAFQEEKWEKTSDFLDRILNLDPDDRDAIEKLKIAKDQQRLINLRLQIPQAMDNELWEEAEKLVEEALSIEPDDVALKAYQEKIARQLSIAETIAHAKEAESRENWQKVANLCLEALRLDPSHVEELRLLTHAREQILIARLHQQITTARKKGDKQEELKKLIELQEVAPPDAEINARIETLQKTIELEACYAKGKQAYDEGKWEAAVEALERVAALNPFYRDAASLLLDAQKRLDQELSVKRDTQRRQELQNLFEEGEELIRKKQWQAAWEIFKKIRQDKQYQNVVSKKELLTRMLYVSGRRCAEAREWYLAKCCFAKALAHTPNYRDTEQQIAKARTNNFLRRHYNIKRTLGPGATSQVDYAEDMDQGQRVVSLKYLKASHAIHRDESRYFRRRAQQCTKLAHPCIVKILAVEMRGLGDVQGAYVDVPVVVMEYIEGLNLAEFLRRTQGVSERQAINFTRQLCQALEYAHEHGILHLDIKPSNILIQTDGLLKLTDFAHTAHGTGGYRPPEQVQRSVELDERTDIFAAGKVLYALLTGKLPSEDPLDEEDPSFQKIIPLLREIIRKATKPDPKDRYQSAQEMLEALEKAKAVLPFGVRLRDQVSNAKQKAVSLARTWKRILPLSVLLTIVLTVAAAGDASWLGRRRDEIIKSILSVVSLPTTTRYIGDVEILIDNSIIQSGFYGATAEEEIHISVRARDTNGEDIPEDELKCHWEFNASPQAGEQCTTIYRVSPDQASQSVDVLVEGKEPEKILNRAEDTIYFRLQSVGGNTE